MTTAGHFKLYGMYLSWYTDKLRPYLQFKGIAFDEQVPSMYTFYRSIKKACGNPTLPVLVTPEGEWLQDTSIIIERLEQRFPTAPVVPREPVQRFAAHLIELWGDEFWQSSAMYTRWSFYPENYPVWEEEAMRAFAPGLPRVLQRRIAQVPATRMRNYLPRLGCTARQNPLLERWTVQQCEALDAHFAEHPFVFGSRPSIADFGLLGPLYGHLGRDVRSSRVYLDPCPHLSAWIRRMNALRPGTGTFLEQDQIPGTLAPVFGSIFQEMVPYMAENVKYVNSLLPTLQAGERLPRFEGEVTFPLAGGTFSRAASPYTLWMAQRTLDLLDQMTELEEKKVRGWLEKTGGQDLLQLNIPRLRRVGLQAAPEWPIDQPAIPAA